MKNSQLSGRMTEDRIPMQSSQQEAKEDGQGRCLTEGQSLEHGAWEKQGSIESERPEEQRIMNGGMDLDSIRDPTFLRAEINKIRGDRDSKMTYKECHRVSMTYDSMRYG